MTARMGRSCGIEGRNFDPKPTDIARLLTVCSGGVYGPIHGSPRFLSENFTLTIALLMALWIKIVNKQSLAGQERLLA